MKQVQWFPGHMVKARRQVEEKLGVIDIVFELLDARAVISSMNPDIPSIIKNKPRLLILNKADLADPNVTKSWIQYFQSQGLQAVSSDATQDDLLPIIKPVVEQILAPLREKERKKGMKDRPIRVMVLGIPNVGKSQFINRLSNRNKTKTGDKPGITKIQQYLRIGDHFEILDNPGILWHKFEDPMVGLKLALLGSIKDEILPLDDLVLFGIHYLKERYPSLLKDKYKSVSNEDEEILAAIGRSRGVLQKGGMIDYERVMKLFLFDLRNGKLGRISYDRVESD